MSSIEFVLSSNLISSLLSLNRLPPVEEKREEKGRLVYSSFVRNGELSWGKNQGEGIISITEMRTMKGRNEEIGRIRKERMTMGLEWKEL